MNNKIIEGLTNLGIFSSKSISKSDYIKLSKENTDTSFMYLHGKNDFGFNIDEEWFKEIDTNELSKDEIKLLLQINCANNIKTIKNILLFYFGITAVCLIIVLFRVIIP